jgi:hypothetical protein
MAKQIKQANPGVTGSQSLIIPITNVFDGNDYSAQMLLGSNKAPANLILDTGSSTLAVTPNAYPAKNDTNLTATTYAQQVMYGTGGWIGPVINTSMVLGNTTGQVTLQNAPIAITEAQQPNNFTGVDGIMGLAFNALNGAYDFGAYLTKTHPKSPKTFPWPFKSGGHFTIFANKFSQLLASQKIPATTIVPYFTELAQKGVVANKFAFYTKRSGVHTATTDKTQIANDPLNQGFFILGGGEEQTNLYTGNFMDVDVEDDLYYNTNLVAVQVAGGSRVAALPLQPEYSQMGSNSIIDSGTSILALSNDVYNAIITSLKALNPNFITQINTANATGLQTSALNLADWPDINFILTGLTGNEVILTCAPSTYWQVNFPQPGIASFQVSASGGDANQSILGLPLMNNYYTVFDRSLDKEGIIRFAAIK